MADKKLEITGSFRDNLSPGLRKVQNTMASFLSGSAAGIKGFVGGIFSMKSAVLGLGAAIVGSRIVGSMHGIIEAGAKLNDQSKALGVSVESLSELAYAMERVGGSAEDAGPVLGRLNKVLGQIKGGGADEARRAFRDLGISVTDLSTMKADQALFALSTAMAALGDETEAAEKAATILGRGLADKLLPVLLSGGRELEAMRAEARKLGITLSTDAAKAMDDFDDAWKSLKGTMTGVLRDVMVAYLPDATKALKEWGEWTASHKDEILGFFRSLANGVAAVAEAFQSVAAARRSFAEAFDRANASGDFDPGLLPHNAEKKHGWESVDPVKWQRELAGGPATGKTGVPLSKGDTMKAWAAAAAAMQEAMKGTTDFNAGLKQTIGLLEELSRAVDDFSSGFRTGFNEAIKKWTDFEKAGREAADKIVDGGLDKLSNSLTDVVTGAKSAKDAFREFAMNMASEIVNVTIRLAIMGAIKTAVLGFAKGGVIHGQKMPVRTYADGGVARGPQLAVYGEGRNAEAFVPLPDGRSIPVTMSGGGRAGTVVFNINALDGPSVGRWFHDNRKTLWAMMNHGLVSDAEMRASVRRTVA